MSKLYTRSDFDGLVAGMLMLKIGLIGDGDVVFVHPKDVQDGKVELDENCITTNLPFDNRVGMAFDHHESETERLGEDEQRAKDEGRLVLEANAKSAARVVYNYYKDQIGDINEEILDAVDKCDSADFSLDEILHPTGWVLLHYIMDARTGLGRFHDFRISNYDLMMLLMHYCLDHTIDEIMALPDVQERVQMYFEHEKLAEAQLERVTTIRGNTAVIDLRNEETIYTGNRFKIYAMYPEVEFSIHVAWGRQKMNTALMIGKSIVNKEGTADIGKICLEYGGGGHAKAGTCQVDNDKTEIVLDEILEKLKDDDTEYNL